MVVLALACAVSTPCDSVGLFHFTKNNNFEINSVVSERDDPICLTLVRSDEKRTSGDLLVAKEALVSWA